MLSRDGLYNSRARRIPQNPRDFGRAWHSGRPRVTMREPMASDFNPDAELVFPEIALELVEDVSPPSPAGFLRLVRRRLRARTPDGSITPDFVYDETARRATAAVFTPPPLRRGGERWVSLRSASRPPLFFRDPTRSPVPEATT